MDKRAIQKEKQRARYYRSARSLVRVALKEYNQQFIEDLKKCQTPAQMKALAEKPLRSAEIEKALLKIWVPVSRQFGTETFNSLMPVSKSLKFEPNIGGLVRPTDLAGNARSVIGLQGSIDAAAAVNEDFWLTWANKMLKGTLGERIKWITETTRDVFIKAVDRIAYAGFESGKGVPEIAKEIMKDLNITERYRAERIARTEVISASNSSSQAGAQATGLELDKEWIAYIDENTRDSHRDLNGAKVDINEQFSNGLDVPGDPSGAADEVINCRCTVGYGSKEGSGFNWGRDI